MGSPNQNTKLKDTSAYNSILTNGNKNQKSSKTLITHEI
jgi:hypothetical protein